MGKITKIELSENERIKLNLGFKEGTSHCYRMRCKAVLLKSEGHSSKAIGEIVEMTQISVNKWVNRYLLSTYDFLITTPFTDYDGVERAYAHGANGVEYWVFPTRRMPQPRRMYESIQQRIEQIITETVNSTAVHLLDSSGVAFNCIGLDFLPLSI